MNFWGCLAASSGLLFGVSFVIIRTMTDIEKDKESRESVRALAKTIGSHCAIVTGISAIAVIVGLLGIIWSAWK